MFASLLRRFGFGKPQSIRKNQSYRPAFESLEKRELMAASLQAALGTNGVLRVEGTARADTITVRQDNNLISVAGVAISTPSGAKNQVAASAIRKIEVFGLDGNDTIRLDQGTQPLRIDALLNGGGGHDTLVGGAGADTYFLGTQEHDRVFGYSGADQLVFSQPEVILKSAVRSTTGLVYTLRPGNQVFEGGSLAWGNYRDFAIAPDGTIYLLGTDDKLIRSKSGGGWEPVTEKVVKFYLTPSGTCYSLTTENKIFENKSWAWTNYRDMAIAPNGIIYLLGTDNTLIKQKTGGWENVHSYATDTVKFFLAPDGTCYSLSTDNQMALNGAPPTWGNTLDFAVAKDGTVYWLGTRGLLQKKAPGSSRWENVHSYPTNTIKFSLAPDGTCYSLSADNKMAVNGAPPSWGNTRDFAVAKDGTVYWLGTGGLLQKKAPGSSRWDNVHSYPVYITKFNLDQNGNCYSLSTDNKLAKNGVPQNWDSTNVSIRLDLQVGVGNDREFTTRNVKAPYDVVFYSKYDKNPIHHFFNTLKEAKALIERHRSGGFSLADGSLSRIELLNNNKIVEVYIGKQATKHNPLSPGEKITQVKYNGDLIIITGQSGGKLVINWRSLPDKDGASIPAPVQQFLAKKHLDKLFPSVWRVHDYLYSKAGINKYNLTRLQADQIMLQMLNAKKVLELEAWLIYQGVRKSGFLFFGAGN